MYYFMVIGDILATHEHFYWLWTLQTTRMVDGDWKEASEWLVGHLSFVDFRASCWISREPGCSCFAWAENKKISIIILRYVDVAYPVCIIFIVFSFNGLILNCDEASS